MFEDNIILCEICFFLTAPTCDFLLTFINNCEVQKLHTWTHKSFIAFLNACIQSLDYTVMSKETIFT